MVLPLVMLVAILPGLAALNAWDLTPPGPMWGLRGLAVLDGLVLDQTRAGGRNQAGSGVGGVSCGRLPTAAVRLAGGDCVLVQY